MASVVIAGSIVVPGNTSWTINGTVTTVKLDTLQCTFNSSMLTVPTMQAGKTFPKIGINNNLVLNETDTQSFMVTLASAYSYVTLTSIGNGVGSVCNYLACNVGDQLIYDSTTSLGVSQHEVTNSGFIKTDYLLPFTIWHRNNGTGLLTKLLVNNSGEVVDLTAITKGSSSPYIDGRNV